MLTAVLVLLSSSGALAQLQVLDVPFISQSEDLCGGAAAAMVLRYWGERGIDAGSFAPLLDRSRSGISTSALVADLERRGWNATGINGSDVALDHELSAGRPVIALIEDRPGRYHYVVIVARSERGVVFHDPARAPFRVMSQPEFARRWQRTGRWMAVVTPKTHIPNSRSQVPAPKVPGTETASAAASPCDALVAGGVALAQANDLAGAERVLTGALACPGVAAMRELAGVRALQRRWAEAETLASEAAAQDPRDEYLWRLLGTAKFLLDDPSGALRAWNVIGEPKVDLVRVDGLVRTRQGVVERLVGVSRGDLLTPGSLLGARRRLQDLPAAFSTRVDFVPVPSGLVELHATVAERSAVPTDAWSLASLGVSAAAEREVHVVTGSLTGGGESVSADWRFWPGRPRVAVGFSAPAPWGGTWSIEGATERQPFSVNGVRLSGAGGLAPDSTDRTIGRLSVAGWVTPTVRLAINGGLERWDSPSTAANGTAGIFALFASHDDRLQASFDVDLSAGPRRSFATTDGSVWWQSSQTQTGLVSLVTTGMSFAADQTPVGAWFAGDTGHARDTLLRAHPVLDDGGLRVERLGRTLFHASGELQQWWTVKSVVHVGAAAFVDHAVTARRLDAVRLADVDIGVGLRIAAPLLPGVVRVDLAKGLRDGETALSVVYAPQSRSRNQGTGNRNRP